MDLREFRERTESALAAREVVIAMTHCAVTYDGRAETFLARGDRILIIKSDRSLLIHQPSGTNAINYMKKDTEISFDHADGHLLLHACNRKEKAWLDIEIFRVYETIAGRLEDGQDIQLQGDERSMSDHIRANPILIDTEFRPLAREEQTDVGFIDVFGHDGQGNLLVVECKRVTASLSAVDQLRRYVERVKQIRGTEDVVGFLAAPGITPNARQMLEGYGFLFVQVDPPRRLRRWRRDQKSLVDF